MLKNHSVVAIIRKEGKYLLLEDSRELMFGHWAPPHGRCNDLDSSEKNAVIREVFEETNLNIKPIKKLWTTKADTKVKTVSFWLVNILNGKIKIDKEESSNYNWFTLEECLKLKLYPGTKKFFELVQKGGILF